MDNSRQESPFANRASRGLRRELSAIRIGRRTIRSKYLEASPMSFGIDHHYRLLRFRIDSWLLEPSEANVETILIFSHEI